MNPYLQKAEKVVAWTLAIVIAIAGLIYCGLGVWSRGLLGLGLACLAAPPIGAHPCIRLGAIMLGMLTL